MPALSLSAGDGGPRPGFHGKVPSKGDFVMSRLPRSFIEPWDAWLQASVDYSRQALGEAWLPLYLTSPVWRFVLTPGVCGETTVAGVLIPSVDRVGRYYPFLIAVALPDCANPAGLPATGAAWFDAAERLALSSLDDGMQLERLDEATFALGVPAQSPEGGAAPAAMMTVFEHLLQLPTEAAPSFPALYPALLDRVLAAVFIGYSLWWTAGSEHVAPCVVMSRGLPEISGFAAFLDGDWQRWGWPGAAEPLPDGRPDDGDQA